MGLCVSLRKNSDSKASPMKVLSFRYQTEELPSPVKEKQQSNGVFPVQSPSISKDFGSKDETFFDTRVWLDSDCEDDFYSVNGDFSSSRGSTPGRNSFSRGTTPIHRSFFDRMSPSPVPEPSPVPTKKKLIELFQESIREKPDFDEQNASEKRTTIKDILPNGDEVEVDGEKSFRHSPCCIPSCRKSIDRKKKMNHTITVK